jgi:hypothetical protein
MPIKQIEERERERELVRERENNMRNLSVN